MKIEFRCENCGSVDSSETYREKSQMYHLNCGGLVSEVVSEECDPAWFRWFFIALFAGYLLLCIFWG